MARSAQLNERMRDASRRRILKAALRLFATHGYAGTSIRMIARAASISVGLLYNYFPSKADLLGALFEESMRDVQASFASAEAANVERAAPSKTRRPLTVSTSVSPSPD